MYNTIGETLSKSRKGDLVFQKYITNHTYNHNITTTLLKIFSHINSLSAVNQELLSLHIFTSELNAVHGWITEGKLVVGEVVVLVEI